MINSKFIYKVTTTEEDEWFREQADKKGYLWACGDRLIDRTYFPMPDSYRYGLYEEVGDKSVGGYPEENDEDKLVMLVADMMRVAKMKPGDKVRVKCGEDTLTAKTKFVSSKMKEMMCSDTYEVVEIDDEDVCVSHPDGSTWWFNATDVVAEEPVLNTIEPEHKIDTNALYHARTPEEDRYMRSLLKKAGSTWLSGDSADDLSYFTLKDEYYFKPLDNHRFVGCKPDLNPKRRIIEVSSLMNPTREMPCGVCCVEADSYEEALEKLKRGDWIYNKPIPAESRRILTDEESGALLFLDGIGCEVADVFYRDGYRFIGGSVSGESERKAVISINSDAFDWMKENTDYNFSDLL